ncbi:MAG TPA: hypothetical protein VK489_06290 [Ferruginibacter sp.]|nr:hypothetical protein [Ferruginibacter sp.]
MLTTKMDTRYKKWLIALFILLLAGGTAIWWIFTEKFTDTAAVKADHTVDAMDFINEFKTDLGEANKKYTEKIIIVNGTVSEIKNADTTSNIIMTDTTSGAYIIFAFQQQHLAEAKALKMGEMVSIKGSCSGGTYSGILETQSINFKRCAVNK